MFQELAQSISIYSSCCYTNKQRVVDDWGVKYNITANMIREGIRSIHERGGKVMLAYGGTLEHDTDIGVRRSGIAAMGGGGKYFANENGGYANQLAYRISQNIQDWDLDGVDFFFAGELTTNWAEYPGYNVAYHRDVISAVRELVGPSKTISYSTTHQPFSSYSRSHEVAVIASCHPYLDYINIGGTNTVLSYEAIAQLEMFGVPLSKVGVVLVGLPKLEAVQDIAHQVKELGMSGINLFSINKENESYKGEYARMVAEALYL